MDNRLIKELDLPADAEHYRRQARFYLHRCDRLEQQNTVMREVLKAIWEQGGDVVEKWASETAGRVMLDLYQQDAEDDER